MPSSLYTNASPVTKRPRTDYTVDVMKPPSVQAQILKELYGNGSDPVAEAKAFLAKPSVLDTTDPEAAAYAERVSTTPHQHPSFKDFTETAKMGGSLGLEAIEKSPRPINPLLRMGAGAAKYASPLYAVPAALSGLRQLITPERSGSIIVPDEESRLGGLLELGGAALSAGSMVTPKTGLRPSKLVPTVADRTGKAAQSRFLARQLADTGYAPGAVQKITGIRKGTGFSRELPYQQAGTSVTPPSPIQQFYARNPMGAGRMTGQFTEGPGGLFSLKSLLPENAPRPYQNAAERAGYPQVEADQILSRYVKSVPGPDAIMGENLTTLGEPWIDLTPELSRFPIERLPKGGSTKARMRLMRERAARKRQSP